MGLMEGEDHSEVYHTSKFIEDVPMIMSVEIGRTDMLIKDILALKKGSVIEFTKVVGEPMDVVVSERLMARGEVVVVNERYGIRISEVTRPDEKIGDKRE
jgi:flagellar motor switch protein FliN/FliY